MRTRDGARIVLLNERGEIFLFRFLHSDDGRCCWVTPGGVEPGESFEEAARRELWEETGLRDTSLGRCVWARDAAAASRDGMPARERFFLVRTTQAAFDATFSQEHETQDVYVERRWWSAAAMRASPDTFWPIGLADLLVPLAVGRLPAETVRLTTY